MLRTFWHAGSTWRQLLSRTGEILWDLGSPKKKLFCSITEVSFPICALDAWVPGKSLENEREKTTRDPVTPPCQLTEPLCSVEGLGIRVSPGDTQS